MCNETGKTEYHRFLTDDQAFSIIIFTSDNGYNCGSHGFGGKVLPYEEGSRTPLIIYDPRSNVNGGKWTSSLAGNVDIAPTVLSYAGVKIPENMDGYSLSKVVEKPSEKVRETLPLIQVWGTSPNFAFTVVGEEFKYIYWLMQKKWRQAKSFSI